MKAGFAFVEFDDYRDAEEGNILNKSINMNYIKSLINKIFIEDSN